MARLVEFRRALEREWAETQTQVRHEDENPNPNPNPNGSLKKKLWGHSFIERIVNHMILLSLRSKLTLNSNTTIEPAIYR